MVEDQIEEFFQILKRKEEHLEFVEKVDNCISSKGFDEKKFLEDITNGAD